MLSIIVSSYQPEKYLAFEQSVSKTIGLPFEIIKIDNPGKMGICEAYNRGAQRAQYAFFLFVHDDVSFESDNWGSALLPLLQSEHCGIVGVAGSNYFGHVPAPWWCTKPNYIHLIQSTKHKVIKKFNRENFNNDNLFEKVKSLDGVFMACTREVYLQHPFDESFKGYHGYDLIFSLTVAQKYQNYVTSALVINHHSMGTLNKDWLLALLDVRFKVNPSTEGSLDVEVEVANFYRLIDYLKVFKMPIWFSFKTLFSYGNFSLFGWKNSFNLFWYSKILLKR